MEQQRCKKQMNMVKEQNAWKKCIILPLISNPMFFHVKSILIDVKRYVLTNLSFTILFELKKKPSHTLKDFKLETLPCQIEHLWHQTGHLWCQTKHYFQIHIFSLFFGPFWTIFMTLGAPIGKFTIPLLTLKAIKLCSRILSFLSVWTPTCLP
jgi:hypothetical protein